MWSWNVLLRPAVALRRKSSAGNDLSEVPAVVNLMLAAVIAAERYLPVRSWPGVSLVVRARRHRFLLKPVRALWADLLGSRYSRRVADALRYCIVVPVYNEEESITELAVRLQARAQPLYLVRETRGFDDWTGSAVSVADNQALDGRSGDWGG